MKFVAVQAVLQPGTEMPYLVHDPADPRRYVGVRKVPCAKPAPRGDGCLCAGKGAHFAPAVTVTKDDSHLRAEIGAGTLELLAEHDANDIVAARAALEG